MAIFDARLPRVLIALALLAVPAKAASLPEHRPLRLLIVSDEVNPHGLSAPELTQPGDLSTALDAPGSGIEIDGGMHALREIGTDQIELATLELERGSGDPLAYDVLIYFAHRIPVGGTGPARQAAFTDAVEQFLVRGGGVVSFHHGSYLGAGKDAILERIGGVASGAVVWNTISGQNVINVAENHFVTCHEVTYPSTTTYSDPARGIPNGTYPLFNNTPDERYLNFDLHPSAGIVEILFASDFVQNGTTHLLGFTHTRPEWSGVVVAYQPGEHQPTALDDLTGPNFQILANSILYAAGRVAPDGIRLRVDRGAGNTVDLEWDACDGPYSIYRSDLPDGVEEAANLQGSTAATLWNDAPPAGVQFYSVVY